MVKHEMTINEVQALTREMLQDLANFVSQNNRRLLLLGGSMLGLVRHDGFIPWDDDLDVGLFREDYDWLMKHYQPTNSRFRLMTEEDEDTLVPNARVVDSRLSHNQIIIKLIMVCLLIFFQLIRCRWGLS